MERFATRHPALRRWVCIVLGCFLYALGVNLFLDKNGIAAGGLAGIATVVTRLIPVRLSTVLLVMNVPLFLIALLTKGWGFVKNSIGGFLIYTACVELTSFLPSLTDDLLVASIFGGAAYGLGMALLTLGNASVGGTELINRVLASFFPSIGLGGFCMLVDGAIVVFSMIAFRSVGLGLYAILTILVCSKLSTPLVKRLVWGHQQGDLCLIVTARPAREIADLLIARLGIAVTKLECVGMYSGSPQSILLAAVNQSETVRVKEILSENATESFVVVLPISEVMGGKLL